MAARLAFDVSMLSSVEAVAALLAVLFAGTLISQLASWVRYRYKTRKIPLAHDMSLFERVFTRKAEKEFVTEFKSLSRKGLHKVDLPHLMTLHFR